MANSGVMVIHWVRKIRLFHSVATAFGIRVRQMYGKKIVARVRNNQSVPKIPDFEEIPTKDVLQRVRGKSTGQTLRLRAGVSDDGSNHSLYPGFAAEYVARARRFRASDYEIATF